MYREYNKFQSALRKQLLHAVEEKYIKHHKSPYTEYTTLTVLSILNHIFTKYANINPSEKNENTKRMKTLYDPNDPLAILFTQIQEEEDYASHANTPLSD